MSSDNSDSAIFVRSYPLGGVESAYAITCAPNGDLYVTRGHSVYVLPKDRVSTLVAGSGTRKSGFKDGPAKEALFKRPGGLLVTSDNIIYICDSWNHRIRIIKDGIVSTFAGTGVKGFLDGINPLKAQFDSPSRILEKSGVLYLTDTGNKRLRMIKPNGEVSSLFSAEKGSQHIPHKRKVTSLDVSSPTGLALSPNQKRLVFSDQWTHSLFYVTGASPSADASSSSESTLKPKKYSGRTNVHLQGGHLDTTVGSQALFNSPLGITFDRYGNLLVCDRNNHSIRLVDTQGAVSTVVGKEQKKKDGVLSEARTSCPVDICTLPNGDVAWVEKEGAVRIMTWSCRRSISLAAILKDPKYGDITVQQQLTGTQFYLNKQIIGFHPNIDLEQLKKVIEDARVPSESVEAFLALFYGSLYRPSKDSVTKENAAILVHLMVLTKMLASAGWEDQIHWLEELFDKYCRLMDSKVLYLLLTSEARHALIHEPVADIMISNLQTRRFHSDHPLAFHRVTFDGHAAEVRDLVLSKLGSAEPLVFKRSVHSSGAPLLTAIGIGLTTLELSPGDWSITIASNAPSSAKPAAAPSTAEQRPDPPKHTMPEWLAYLRWPFFRRLLHAGLQEVQQKSIELPSDFPPRLLRNIIACIYRGNVDARMKKMDLPTCDYALSNAAEYGLSDPITGKITDTFHTLFRYIHAACFELEHPQTSVPARTDINPALIPGPPSTQDWFDQWQSANTQISPTD